MLVLQTSRRYLLKIYSGFGINHSHHIKRQKALSAFNHVSQPTHTDGISCGSCRFFMQSSIKYIEQPPASDQTDKIGELTEYHAYDMIHKLTDNDRKALSNALSRYDSEKTKSKFQGELSN